MERRVAAFAVDAVLLFFFVLGAGAAVEAIGATAAQTCGTYCNPLILACISIAFVAYHSAGLVNRDIGVGRVVTGTSVVSLKAGPELSIRQCVGRPVVRALWLLVGLWGAKSFREPMILCAPLLLDLVLLTFHPLRQTIADIICKTVVMNVPPLQPHRAPAGPMFSREDAEFGPGPRNAKANKSVSVAAP